MSDPLSFIPHFAAWNEGKAFHRMHKTREEWQLNPNDVERCMSYVKAVAYYLREAENLLRVDADIIEKTNPSVPPDSDKVIDHLLETLARHDRASGNSTIQNIFTYDKAILHKAQELMSRFLLSPKDLTSELTNVPTVTSGEAYMVDNALEILSQLFRHRTP